MAYVIVARSKNPNEPIRYVAVDALSVYYPKDIKNAFVFGSMEEIERITNLKVFYQIFTDQQLEIHEIKTNFVEILK